MKYTNRKCRAIGNSQGFIIPKKQEEPTIGETYDITIKKSSEKHGPKPKNN